MLIIAYLVLATIADTSTTQVSDHHPTLAEAVAKLRSRHAGIHSLACSYHRESRPSTYLTNLQSTNRKRSLDSEASQLTVRSYVEFAETTAGMFRFVETRAASKSRNASRRTLTFNGKDTWNLGETQREGEPWVGKAEIGLNIAKSFEGEAIVRSLLGDALIPGTDPLYVRLGNGQNVQLLPSNSAAEATWIGVQWEGSPGKAMTRETVWMDPHHDFVTMKYKKEAAQKDLDWHTLAIWTVHSIGSVQYQRNGSKSSETYWYPRDIEHEFYNAAGTKLFDNTYKVADVRINVALSTDYFTPKLEDGTNVIDVRTNRSFVYGGGPSPRLRELLERRVKETKESTSVISNQPLPSPQAPPRDWSGYVSLLAVVVGLFGLITVSVLKFRFKSTQFPSHDRSLR